VGTLQLRKDSGVGNFFVDFFVDFFPSYTCLAALHCRVQAQKEAGQHVQNEADFAQASRSGSQPAVRVKPQQIQF
jgi:hypothetical protein